MFNLNPMFDLGYGATKSSWYSSIFIENLKLINLWIYIYVCVCARALSMKLLLRWIHTVKELNSATAAAADDDDDSFISLAELLYVKK
jgi:hypothetical protein